MNFCKNIIGIKVIYFYDKNRRMGKNVENKGERGIEGKVFKELKVFKVFKEIKELKENVVGNWLKG